MGSSHHSCKQSAMRLTAGIRSPAKSSSQGSPAAGGNWFEAGRDVGNRGLTPILLNWGLTPICLVQVGLLEEVVAVGGVHGQVDERRLAQYLERNDRAGRAEPPDAPP